MQQTPQLVKVVTTNERKTTEVFYVRTDLIMRSEDTGGTYSSYEIIAQPGRGAKTHIHSHEDEALYIIEGLFQVRCGEKEYTLGAGDSISMPKGLPHMFTNIGQTTGRLLGIATPAGLEGFFEDIDALVKAKQVAVTREEFTAVCDKYGIEFLHQS